MGGKWVSWTENSVLSHGPFHGFFQLSTWTSSGKSVDTTQKSTLKLVKITTFECDLSKTNGDTPPQSHKILQKFVWWGTSLCPPPYIRTSVKFRGFNCKRCTITFKFGNCTNFKALFPVVSTDFPWLVLIKSWNNLEKVCYANSMSFIGAN